MNQLGEYRREATLPYNAVGDRANHPTLREYIYRRTGDRRDHPLNVLLFGPTQVGKGSAINGICQALVPADVSEPIPVRAGVGPHADNGQNTPFLRPVCVGEGFPITLWDCMGFDTLDEIKMRHALGVLTGFQRPNEPINLAATPDVVSNGEQFYPHVILFVIPYAEAQGGLPWLDQQSERRNQMMAMAGFVKNIAREQGSQVILVVTRQDLYKRQGFDTGRADAMVCLFAGALGVNPEDCLPLDNDPRREVRDWKAECFSLELVKRCIDKAVGVYVTKGRISYALVITKAWYGADEVLSGNDVTAAICRLVGTLFEPAEGGGSNLEQRRAGAYFLANSTTMADPVYYSRRGIWIDYSVEKRVLGRLLEPRNQIERRAPQRAAEHRFTAESFKNPFLA